MSLIPVRKSELGDLLAWLGVLAASPLLFLLNLRAKFKLRPAIWETKNSGKVICITGCSSEGIGTALARLYAKDGCKLAICARREPELNAVASELRSLGAQDVLAVVADVAKTEDCKKFIDAIAEHYGGQLDCVVLNAGVTTGDILEKLDLDAIHNLLDINIRGVVDTTYFSLPLLTKAPRPKIIGISSTAGIIGVPTRAPYAFSKFGMKGFLDALRNEYEHRIEITTIYPGPVRTDINRTRTGSQDLSWEGAMPLETAAKLIYDAAREGTMDLVFAPYTALKWIRDWFPYFRDMLAIRTAKQIMVAKGDPRAK